MRLLEDLTVPPWWPGGFTREQAMTVPTLSRARDLLCSLLGSLPLTLWGVSWPDGATEPTTTPLPPYPWQRRPDPARTRNWILAWTTDDLIWHGRSYWRVAARYAPATVDLLGYPMAFEWMPAAQVEIPSHPDAPVRWQRTEGEGGLLEVDQVDVLEFLSPLSGLLETAGRSVTIAVALDEAAARFASMNIPAGWLRQTSGEPMSAEQLAVMAANFAAARETMPVAAINEALEYHESAMDPAKLELVPARQYQSLELARHANVPPYLVGAPAGTGMTYLNAQQARSDLAMFGALPYVHAIEQTLSGPNVVPQTQMVRLDVNAWLRDPLAPPGQTPADDSPVPTPGAETETMPRPADAPTPATTLEE